MSWPECLRRRLSGQGQPSPCPTAEEEGPRPRIRKNGWDPPPSPQLVITLLVFFGDLAAFCTLLAPVLQQEGLWYLILLFFAAYCATAVPAVWTMSIDPADPGIDEDLEPGAAKLACKTCKKKVHQGSKHCWDCNKCVEEFDHHCIWLNSCIGRRNYVPFFVTICMFFLMLTLLNVCTVVSCTLQFISGELFLPVVYGCVLVVNLPIWVCDASLLVFHIFLCWKGTTTLAFIKGRAAQQAAQREQRRGEERRTWREWWAACGREVVDIGAIGKQQEPPRPPACCPSGLTLVSPGGSDSATVVVKPAASAI